MYNWFECKVSFDKMGEDGLLKRTSESYLVDALSFTEAEKRISKEMQPFISGEFLVANIKRVKITDLFYNEGGDKWYRCKVNLIIPDEDKGIERKSAVTMMVQATNLQEAVEQLIAQMKTSLSDYEIVNVTETMLMDVFAFAPAEKE
ncbi:MAG: DUF4494 domain-containing protein [Sphingobacteriia bacterium]|jgi:hypothetical protein|nr:DUF4494 domain-containing protein [Paludibacteraceae bacterium]NCA79394.1 DUF4494 domain-containing protein [Sphingobacteriia bacterium]